VGREVSGGEAVNPLLSFWLLLRASLFSTSGTGNLPLLHDDYLARGWATERQFVEALAVGQVSPGPAGLWVVSLGYLTDGIRGSLLATVAITIPPILIVFFERIYLRYSDKAAMEGFTRGLSLSGIGIFTLILIRILSSQSPDLKSVGILLGAIALGTQRKIPVIAILVLAAVAGMVLYSG
jgi:chromate transporter